MKRIGFLAVLLAALSNFPVIAQTRLSDSATGSSETLIYKVGRDELRDLCLRDKQVGESMLHTFVAGYTDSVPALPRGNYLAVRAEGNRLSYRVLTVDDLCYAVVGGGQVMLRLYDTLGRVIPDAAVRRGMKRLRFDPRTQTYNTGRVGDEKYVEVDYKGVYHYIEFGTGSRYKPDFFSRAGYQARRFWHRIKSPFTRKGPDVSFIAFSKPRYKPGETVRLKAYAGRPSKQSREVRLKDHYYNGLDTVLTCLRPYRPGMYEYAFRLSDSLRLRLDKDYTVQIGKARGSFRYEEYELQKLKFTAKASEKEYFCGDTVKILLTARDQNDMAVYDGRISLTLIPARYGSEIVCLDIRGFVPDTLWHYEGEMKGRSETEVIVPDSVFPRGVSLSYTLDCVLLDAENERQAQKVNFRRDGRTSLVDCTVDKGFVTIRKLENGESVACPAQLTTLGRGGAVIRRETVELPYTAPVPWYASGYTVDAGGEHGRCDVVSHKQPPVSCYFAREGDDVRLRVDNPAGIPFWYTITRGRRTLAQGYADSLDYSRHDGGKAGWSANVAWIFWDKPGSTQAGLPYMQQNLSMDVSAPGVIYPGQTTPIEVSVENKRGRPVRNADVTAWAVTSKFDASAPRVPIQGKSKYARGTKIRRYDPGESPAHGNARMAWDYWRERLGLDTVEYYRFLHPAPIYTYSEPDRNGVTQIAPYALLDGEVQGVQILWIDEQPHFFAGADRMRSYDFPVGPGAHTLRLRLRDREVTVRDVMATEGSKTIVSVDCGASAGKVGVAMLKKQQCKEMSTQEIASLTQHMITVEPTFPRLRLPEGRSLPRPAVLDAGGTLYWLNEKEPSYRYVSGVRHLQPLLAGPFSKRLPREGETGEASFYLDSTLFSRFDIEGGYKYTLYRKYPEKKRWETEPFGKKVTPFVPPTDFARHALTMDDIRLRFLGKFMDILGRSTGKIEHSSLSDGDHCRLSLTVGKLADGRTDARPVMVLLACEENPHSVWRLYLGATRNFRDLPEGRMRAMLIFDDTTHWSACVTLRSGGRNWLTADSIRREAPNSLSRGAFRLLDTRIARLNGRQDGNELLRQASRTGPVASRSGSPVRTSGSFSALNQQQGVITGMVISRNDSIPIVGAMITVDGTRLGATTDASGRFVLDFKSAGIDPEGKGIIVSFIGFEPLGVILKAGYDYSLALEEMTYAMEEVVARKGVVSTNADLTGVTVISDEGSGWLNASDFLEGRVSGTSVGVTLGLTSRIRVRGTSSLSAGTGPLYVVDGVPVENAMDALKPDDILSIDILKDASATAIYGSRGANGVVIIRTKGKGALPGALPGVLPGAQSADAEPAQSLRRNFHDDAFWQPRLATGRDGKARFEVAWPDDITSWRTHFIAIGSRCQSDAKELRINSFKALSAQLSLPQFAVRSDSLCAVGRLTNHLPDTARVRVSASVEGVQSFAKELSLAESHADLIPIVATAEDSLTVAYSLVRDDGYSDGEQRTMPLYEQGALQTHGEFALIADNQTHTFETVPGLGPATVHAEASAVDAFLREIRRVREYPYFCNEQSASKIKALLAEKRICETFGRPFKEERMLHSLIARLNRNCNDEGLWGWWNRDKTEFWIARQVVEAMVAAGKAGYRTDIDPDRLIRAVQGDLDGLLTGKQPVPKGELLARLVLLKELDAPIDYAWYCSEIDRAPDRTVHDRLSSMHALQAVGLGDRIDRDTLMSHSARTMMGTLYWKEEVLPKQKHGWSYGNDIDNTLLAYRILRSLGGYEAQLEQMRNYFFEQRRSGEWRNTYESSRIIETIMPDMLAPGVRFEEVSARIGEQQVSEFPYTTQVAEGTAVEVRKSGQLPLFFTLYQQAWNPAPKAESNGFHVSSCFRDGGDTVTALKAGKPVELVVTVTADSDAEYVMVQVPIPAGCSYESKGRGNWSVEAHREYFKERVAIFCNKLPRGEHRFTIKLLPRFTGVCHVNPARAELMYFPTFNGRNDMERVAIE